MKFLLVLAALFISFSSYAANFQCVGTEPFWGGTLSKEKVNFTIMGMSATNEPVYSYQNAAGTSGTFALSVKTKTSTSVLINQECSDGMSDTVYSHHIVFDNGKNIYYGCCSIK